MGGGERGDVDAGDSEIIAHFLLEGLQLGGEARAERAVGTEIVGEAGGAAGGGIKGADGEGLAAGLGGGLGGWLGLLGCGLRLGIGGEGDAKVCHRRKAADRGAGGDLAALQGAVVDLFGLRPAAAEGLAAEHQVVVGLRPFEGVLGGGVEVEFDKFTWGFAVVGEVLVDGVGGLGLGGWLGCGLIDRRGGDGLAGGFADAEVVEAGGVFVGLGKSYAWCGQN